MAQAACGAARASTACISSMRRLMNSAMPLRRAAATRWCAEAAAAPAGVEIEDVPTVLLLSGDAFVEDNFAKIDTSPAWLREHVMPAAESFYYTNGPNKHDNLGAWKPLSATVAYLTSTYNLKVLGWSRHPTDTSQIVYTLLNDARTQTHPTTVVPHYHIDRLRAEWSEGRTPLYYADVQGHSAHVRASPEYIGQEPEFRSEYVLEREAPTPPAKCFLPEMFALVGGMDGSWDTIKSQPPNVLDNIVDEARKAQAARPDLKGALPITAVLNILIEKYGCNIQRQVVTNLNLTKVTYLMEFPHAHKTTPRTPREGRAASA